MRISIYSARIQSPAAILLLISFCLALFALPISDLRSQERALPNPYYPQKPTGQLRLNYYYDRSGRWVKFSDWIPFQRRKYVPRHLEDFYQLYGLSHGYRTAEIKENIYFLVQGLTHRFRHPRNALCQIETEEQYHKYRLLIFMHINLSIMRMFLRLGSLYDRRYLHFYHLDTADDLEISFLIARSYYRQALPFWRLAVDYARQASAWPLPIDLPAMESERFQIIEGELNFDRIIERHLYKVEAKLAATKDFLDREGRPRPVKEAMQEDISSLYDRDFTPYPLEAPTLDPELQEKRLFPDIFPEEPPSP